MQKHGWKLEGGGPGEAVGNGRHVENKARVGHCVTWLQGHVAALRFLLDEKLPSDPDVSGRTLMHEAGMGYGWIWDVWVL